MRPDLEAAEAEAMEDELALAFIETAEQVALRFDLPIQWAHMHQGVHRCLDGRMYRVSCLVTDPTCDRVAKSYLRLAEEERSATQ